VIAFAARVRLEVGDVVEAEKLAAELLTSLARDTILFTDPDWSGALAIVLRAMDRGGEFRPLVERARYRTRWLLAADAIAAGEFAQAADRYAEIGSRPDEAWARLHAAEELAVAGVAPESQLQPALDFFRAARATGYLQAAESLLVR
jgi:hypothetical protein